VVKILLIIITLFILSGCSRTTPAISEFRIDTNIAHLQNNFRGCQKKSLKVEQSFSNDSLKVLDMNYGVGNNREYRYTQSQWADSPNNAVTFELAKMLREAKLFKSVEISKSRAKDDLILETNIEKFMQYFNKDETKSYALVSINFTLIDAKTNIVIRSKKFQTKIKTKSLDAKGGVLALNKALQDVLVQIREYLSGVCR